jgi:hypothetical protein
MMEQATEPTITPAKAPGDRLLFCANCALRLTMVLFSVEYDTGAMQYCDNRFARLFSDNWRLKRSIPGDDNLQSGAIQMIR